MPQVADEHVECARLQREIESYIGLQSNSLIFEYHDMEGKIKLDLITVNPLHRQSFLFHSETGYDKVGTLQKMLEYVQSYKDKESSYTLQWSLKSDDELHTSYFRAKNIVTALDKLYYGRDPNSIVVFSVVLNPIT